MPAQVTLRNVESPGFPLTRERRIELCRVAKLNCRYAEPILRHPLPIAHLPVCTGVNRPRRGRQHNIQAYGRSGIRVQSRDGASGAVMSDVFTAAHRPRDDGRSHRVHRPCPPVIPGHRQMTKGERQAILHKPISYNMLYATPRCPAQRAGVLGAGERPVPPVQARRCGYIRCRTHRAVMRPLPFAAAHAQASQGQGPVACQWILHRGIRIGPAISRNRFIFFIFNVF